MPNQFVNLPAPTGNGVGAAVSVSTFGAIKTIVVGGDAHASINVEFNNAAVSTDGSWQSAATFQNTGQLTVRVAARWMRVRVSGYNPNLGGTPVVDVGGADSGTTFAALVAPAATGAGTPVNTSTLGLFKTVQIGTSFRGTLLVEVSEDGSTEWGTIMSFQTPGSQSMVVAAQFMRVRRVGVPVVNPGLPIINIGATDDVSGDGGVAVSAGSQSVDSGTVVFSNSNNVSFGMSGSSRITASASFPAETPFGLSAGSQSVSTGTLVFSNENGFIFGMSGSSRVTASFDGLRSVYAGVATATGPQLSFANGGNVTFGMIGNTVTASAQTAGGTASGVGISAGTEAATAGAVIFSNSNGITFGLNAQTMTASFSAPPAETPFGVSAGTQSISTGTLVFSNSNNVTFGMSGSSRVTASASFPAETPFGLSAGSQSGSTGTMAFAVSNGITFGMSGSNQITASFDGVRSVIVAGGTATGPNVSFANGSGVTWGINGQTITASVNAGAPETPFGVSAGTQSVSTGTLAFANSNGVTFGMSGSNQITASIRAAASGSAITLPSPVLINTFAGTAQSVTFARVVIPYHLSATQAVMWDSMTGTSNNIGGVTLSVGVYTMSGSTAGLASSGSREFSWASGSETSAASIYGGASGLRARTIPVNFSMTPGDYLMAFICSFSGVNVSHTFVGITNPYGSVLAFDGFETSQFMNGVSIGATAAFPASFNVNDTNYQRTVAIRQPGVALYGTF